MRAFYAQPRIFSHGSLDPISARVCRLFHCSGRKSDRLGMPTETVGIREPMRAEHLLRCLSGWLGGRQEVICSVAAFAEEVSELGVLSTEVRLGDAGLDDVGTREGLRPSSRRRSG